MNVLEKLLSNRWFVKAVDKDGYYQVKDEVGKYQNFLSEKLGYHVIVNPYVVKLEKIPAVPENWMGIMEFNEQMEYVFFCLTLMFLEDKEVDGQFILSQLTEFMQSVWKQGALDWTVYQNRRYLVKVLKYCVKCGILQVYDGSEDRFKNDSQADVLYLNTGVSRYFMRNFTKDIMGVTSPKEFIGDDWVGMDADRGIIRRQRVYRRLLLSMGMERTEETEEDFLYIRNYGKKHVEKDFSRYFDCELQIYRNHAFLVLGEDCNMGKCFPDGNNLADIALLCSYLVRELAAEGKLEINMQDEGWMLENQFLNVIEHCKKEYQEGFAKMYREMTTKEFCRVVMEYLLRMEFVEIQDGRVRIRGGFCRMAGQYPEGFPKGS